MKICFDIDDVLCDTYEVIMKVSAEFHKNVLKKDLMERNVKYSLGDYYYFAKSLQWTEYELYRFYHEAYPDFLRLCKPHFQAIALLRHLKFKGHVIYILTAREERAFEQVYNITKSWLNFFGFPFDFLCVGRKDKYNYIKENTIDIFIDDTWENCKKVSENKNCLVFHMRCNYNIEVKYTYKKNIIPIYDIYEVEKYLCSISK